MCTGIRLCANDGTYIYGRTMEFGRPTDSAILFIPAGYTLSGTASGGRTGLTWQTRYALVGANMLGVQAIVDGVNQEGLAGGLFYFPDYAHYQSSSTDTSTTIAPWELMTLILSTCASVPDVVKKLADIIVAEVIFEPWGFVPPVHAIVHDVNGRSIVIEYIDGTYHLYDNPAGVITNAPTFGWHQTNLKNYSNLSPYNGSKPSFGQGSGMIGLPGDFTPPSRFVRASLFSHFIQDTATANNTHSTVFHILNLFDIPKGLIRDTHHEAPFYDHTQWTSVTDLNQRTYAWRTYENHRIFKVNLTAMLDGVDEPYTIYMHYPEELTNLTQPPFMQCKDGHI